MIPDSLEPTPRRPRPAARSARRRQRELSAAVGLLGLLALLVPLWPELAPEPRLGALLLTAAGLELYHGFRRADDHERRAAWFGGAVTVAMGLLITLAPTFVGGAAVLLVGGWFALDALRFGVAATREARTGRDARWSAIAAAGNLAVVGVMVLLGAKGILWTLAVASALRLFGTAANIAHAPVLDARDAGDSAVRDLGFGHLPELAQLGDRIEAAESSRSRIDAYWIGTFTATLFAIHLGRMGLDRSTLGIVSPAFAVLGDLVVALGIGLGVVVPVRALVRHLTRPLERRAWFWCLHPPAPASTARPRRDWKRRCVRLWLVDRLRFAIRLRLAQYSLPAALARGLQIGLPASAILAATTPMWGMSWYFDTENYAAGIWNSWAEARTDLWRESMIRAVQKEESEAGRPAPTFSVQPPGATPGTDFAFLVIGDTGEGDASQHILRDQLLLASLPPEVRFVVIASDVVYPTGSIRHYEPNFWLPFKGISKPVYAIPGNHDWYDALEGFAATFLEPGAARTVMRARVEADLKLAATTDRDIDRLLAEASRLRAEYRVPTGFQQGPFFQFQTDRFALFAVDTGVRKRLDDAQMAWFREALESARGKLKMAILGHPLYACGEERTKNRPDFAALHALLRRHDVRIVMAGDTHDLEVYVERRANTAPIHHFVNGGGGAFLTMGVQLLPRGHRMPTTDWAFYPPTAPLVAKVEKHNRFWKAPLWWWTREFAAWPSAPEWLSAAFDYNVAPFFQSFFEVRVEPSAGTVRLRPWGVHGRLRWSDLQSSPGFRPEGIPADAPIEWTFELPPAPAPGAPTP